MTGVGLLVEKLFLLSREWNRHNRFRLQVAFGHPDSFDVHRKGRISNSDKGESGYGGRLTGFGLGEGPVMKITFGAGMNSRAIDDLTRKEKPLIHLISLVVQKPQGTNNQNTDLCATAFGKPIRGGYRISLLDPYFEG